MKDFRCPECMKLTGSSDAEIFELGHKRCMEHRKPGRVDRVARAIDRFNQSVKDNPQRKPGLGRRLW